MKLTQFYKSSDNRWIGFRNSKNSNSHAWWVWTFIGPLQSTNKMVVEIGIWHPNGPNDSKITFLRGLLHCRCRCQTSEQKKQVSNNTKGRNVHIENVFSFELNDIIIHTMQNHFAHFMVIFITTTHLDYKNAQNQKLWRWSQQCRSHWDYLNVSFITTANRN